DRAAADARSLGDAHAILSRVLPGRRLQVTLGDQAVFGAVLSALGLPPGWRKRLTCACGSPAMLEAASAACANPQGPSNPPLALASLVARGDEARLTQHIEEAMQAAALSPTAGREPGEIAHRLIEKARLRSVRLSDDALNALKSFLAINTPLAEAGERLAAFAEQAGIVLDG